MIRTGKIKSAILLLILVCFFIFLTVCMPVYATTLKTIVSMAEGYDEILPFNETDRAVRIVNGGLYGLIGLNGKVISEPEYSEILSFSEGYAAFKSDNLWGFINELGHIVVSAEYSEAYFFKDGLAVVSDNGRYGAIDSFGRIRIPLLFEKLGNPGQGLYPARSGGKWGYINRAGVSALPFIYEDAQEFCEGYAVVKSKGKWGIVNKAGTVIVGFEYDYIYNFDKGIAEASKGGTRGYIDRYGVFIADKSKSNSKLLVNTHSSAKYNVIEKDGKKGITDSSGVIIVPAKFAAATLICDRYVVLYDGIKCGLYELTASGGNLTFEKPDGVAVMLDSVYIAFDQKPVIENGRVLAPVKHISESLRADMTYDSNFTTIAVKKGDVKIVFHMGSDIAYVNNIPKKLDCYVRIIGGRTYVPVRFMADMFGYATEWKPGIETVILSGQN